MALNKLTGNDSTDSPNPRSITATIIGDKRCLDVTVISSETHVADIIAAGNLILTAQLAKLQTLQTDPYGELSVRSLNQFRNITGNGTTVVKSGAGILAGIAFNAGFAATTVTLFDNTAGSGTKIATISVGALSLFGTTQQWNCSFTSGLTVVTTGSVSNDITILYK